MEHEQRRHITRYFYKQVYIHTHIFQQRILKKKKKESYIYTYNTDIRLNIYIYICAISQKCVITSKYIYIYTLLIYIRYKAKRRTICTLTKCEPSTDKIEEKRG